VRVAIVVQRYGPDVAGGAEAHARQWAERFRGTLGWDVEVYTSTAQDYVTWKKVYRQGVESINGVVVCRFDAQLQRWPTVFGLVSRVVFVLERMARSRRCRLRRWRSQRWLRSTLLAIERAWYVLQGPYCPGLLATLEQNADRYDRIFFFTYLYYPTVMGLSRLAVRSVLVPTAHDEPPLYFQHTRRLLQDARLILANTPAEADLIDGALPGSRSKTVVAGLGISLAELSAVEPSARHSSAPDDPYVLYLGRVCRGKGVDRLIALFLDYCRRASDGRTRLVLAGRSETRMPIPRHKQVVWLGFIAEEQKVPLIRGARCVINPSPAESLSMIVLEALALGVPLLVNGHCAVLSYFAEETETTFVYRDGDEFVRELKAVLATPWRKQPDAAARLARSQRWVTEHYSWERVLSTITGALEGGAITGPRAAGQR
jgi:glycosyltransferase involved in cell wall biosynthesis